MRRPWERRPSALRPPPSALLPRRPAARRWGNASAEASATARVRIRGTGWVGDGRSAAVREMEGDLDRRDEVPARFRGSVRLPRSGGQRGAAPGLLGGLLANPPRDPSARPEGGGGGGGPGAGGGGGPAGG